MIQGRAYVMLFYVALSALSACGLVTSSHHRTEDYTPVFKAADACDLKKVQAAIDLDPSLLKATEWENATLLHDAVGRNCNELAAYLVEEGADVNAQRTDGITPLHLAAQRGNIQIAQLLIGHGAKINAVDRRGWTPLDRAIKWNHEDMASYLRKQGARSGGQTS